MHASLEHRVLVDAKVQPFEHPMVSASSDGFVGGLVLDDEHHTRLRHTRNRKPVDSFKPGQHYPDPLDGEFIYGGMIYHHFGHFMAEMVHRVVPSKASQARGDWLFVTYRGNDRFSSLETLPAFVQDVFRFLDIERVHVVAENERIGNLFVAEQGSDYGGGPKPGYLEDLREYSDPQLDRLHGSASRPRKLYVSRSGMAGGTFLGERYLESLLRSEGYVSIRPEDLPVSLQMDHYRKAEVVIFPEGSAAHGVELLGSESLGRCYLLARREGEAHVFERILRPRSATFAVSRGHTFLGSIVAHPATGQAEPHRGVYLFNPDALLDFFRSHAIADLDGFDIQDYLDVAEADLLRYFEQTATGGKMFAPASQIAALFSAFREAQNSQPGGGSGRST